MNFLKNFIRTFLFIVLILIPVAVLSCIWDHDTIKMENSRFPDTLELITGKFLRHSKEFYLWRIQDRTKRLESDPTNTNLLDDLAVAYEKTDNHEKAIEIGHQMEKMNPLRYETAANLGTFYLHAGKFKTGLTYIEKAITINSNAHFGREKYQKLLVEYLIEKQPNPPFILPITTITKEEGRRVHISNTFSQFLRGKTDNNFLGQEDTQNAVKGILGMMKFGNYNSPILLEALASLLLEGNEKDDAKLLAARAYLKASYETKSETAKESYRLLANHCLPTQTTTYTSHDPMSLKMIETDLQKELNEAIIYYQNLNQLELTWIKDGKNPEKEFDKLYKNEPEEPPSTKFKLVIFGIMFTAASVIIFITFRKKNVPVSRKYKRFPRTKQAQHSKS